jgi:tetratricopeptide (TPR) repeat protein
MRDAAAEVQRLHRAAQEQLNRGGLDAADESCRQLLALQPAHADAIFLRAMVAGERRQWIEAVSFIKNAIALRSDRVEYHAQLARCLTLLGRSAEALAAADRAMSMSPADALTLDTLGNVYVRADAHERAAQLFCRAAALQPDNAGYRFNLAAALKFIGKLSEAEQAYEDCIVSDPHFWRAHWALAGSRRQTPQHNHIERLLSALPAAAANADALLHMHHALAKEYEDLGRYSQAFAHLLAGKAPKRQTLGYNFDMDRRLFDAIEATFPGNSGALQRGYSTTEPIFVVGMPRTGTTLVERILSSHSQVHAAGELPNFALAVKRLSGTRSNRVLDAQTIARSGAVNFEQLGYQYLQSTRPATGRVRHFVDKMPLNFFYVGHIAHALPQARVICVRRNPLDTCLSNFRQLFAINYPYYHYSYDLLDTGRYYLSFARLMAHWRSTLPGAMLEIQYEDIVNDPQTATRKMLDFCGLEWEESCLRFELNSAAVATASAAQVRQPLYRSSVQRWRHYENELADLGRLLEKTLQQQEA